MLEKVTRKSTGREREFENSLVFKIINTVTLKSDRSRNGIA